MLYIGCQYQAMKKVKKKEAYLPYLSFLQDEVGNTHIFLALLTKSIARLGNKIDFYHTFALL